MGFVVKQSEPMVNKTFRFPASLLDQLEEVAGKYNISVNELVRQMAEYALANIGR